MKLIRKIVVLLGALLLVGCTSTTESPTLESPTLESPTPSDSQTLLSEEQIKTIALAEVPNGTIAEIEIDREDITPNYDVTVIDDTTEYDFEIDAYTGSILSIEKDLNAENATPPTLSEEDAKAVALNEVPGGEITRVHYESDEFIPHYDISVKLGKYEYDIEIDATTGTVREIEKDLMR